MANDANAAIANPELAAKLGVVPGTEKYSVAVAFDPTFPAKQAEAARQSAAKISINGKPEEKGASTESGPDSTATMYDGRKVDFSSNKFVEELMKDKKHIADTLESLTKESEATRKVLDGYMKEAADAKMERQAIENQINNNKSQAYRELAGSGASQSSIDALAAWRNQALEPSYQAALIKEQNTNAIYLGQKDLMQQDWDRRLKATDTYEKLANIDATIFSTTSNRDIQIGQLAVSQGQLALAQKKTIAPGERIVDVSTGKEIGGVGPSLGNLDFGGGDSVSGADLATRLTQGKPAETYAAQKDLASAGNDPKAQMDVLYSLATSKEKDPDGVVEGSAQMVKKMQNAIAAIRKYPNFFGKGVKFQDLLSTVNSQDPKYAELKAAVQAVQAGITTGMFGSRDSSAQMGMTDQMANALKAPDADTALRIMGQVSQQVYRSAVGKLTSQGLSARQADILFRHHITSI